MNNRVNQKWLLVYFKDWKNILTFIFLVLLVAAGFFFRIRNLGYLSFWGDDGHTVIGTLSIIKHGYPLLPSGYVLFHGILDYYLNVIPAAVFGPTEFAFRLTSVLFGCGTIVLIYFAGKETANRFTGFLAAALTAFSTWYIYFSREARYFAALQFFFLISVYFFYKGFVKEQRPFRVAATIFFVISPLIHGNAFFLILAFVALLFYKGRKFFKKQIVVPFLIIFAFYVLQIVNQVFFWKVGRSFFSEGAGLRQLLGAYLKLPDMYYFKILDIMFPRMFYIVIGALAVFIAISVFASIKKAWRFSDMYLAENGMVAGRARFPFNIFLLYFVFTCSVLIISFGQMYNQQRYIYFLMPLFVLIFSYVVYVAGFTLSGLIKAAYNRISKREIGKSIFAAMLVIIFAAISLLTFSGIDLKQNWQVPEIKHTDRLDTLYSISTVMPYHWDAARTGKYVRDNMSEGDIVITTDVYNTYPYTNQIDYWLWTGDLISWQPYHLDENDNIRDDTYGAIVIRNIYDFIDVLNSNRDRNVWVICSYSLTVAGHIDPIFRQFFDNRQQNFILTGRDDVSRLYYFSKTDQQERISIKDFIAPGQQNTISADEEGTVSLDLADPDNQRFLIAGWGDVEKGLGTWAMDGRSLLYVDFSAGKFDISRDSQLSIIAKPLPHPQLTQEVELLINGKLADVIILIKKDDFGQYEIPVNPGSFTGQVNVVEFKYSYNFTPLELGLGPDSRNLSVLFQRLELKNLD